jgi:catechol 2,3-dioxygenase-like lactoylglutathione lyase family enzyme
MIRGPISQVAWVVEDIDAAEHLWATCFGVERWTRLPDIHFGPDTCTFRGQPADFTAHISLVYSGDLQLELIQPVSGESIYTEFVAKHGPGLHHVCFEVEDMAQAVESVLADGLAVLQQGSMADGAMEFAYLDGSAGGAPYIELARIGPMMRDFFTDLRRQSS